MAYLARSEIINRIVRVTREFSDLLRGNRRNVSGNLPGLMENADKTHDMLSRPGTMEGMLMKLNDEALMEMYRKCGELAGLYELSSAGMMSTYATDTLVNFMKDSESADAFMPDIMARLSTEVDRTSSSFEKIITEIQKVDTDRETGILNDIHNGIESAAGMLAFLEPLLPLFSSEEENNIIYELLESLQAIFAGLDMASSKEDIAIAIMNSMERDTAIAQRVANSLIRLSDKTKEITSAINESAMDAINYAREEIKNYFDNAGPAPGWLVEIGAFFCRVAANFEMKFESYFLPVLLLNSRDGLTSLRVEPFVPKVEFKYYAYDTDTTNLTLFFELEGGGNNTFVGGWDLNQKITGSVIGLTNFDLKYAAEKDGNNGFRITLQPLLVIALDKLTKLTGTATLVRTGDGTDFDFDASLTRKSGERETKFSIDGSVFASPGDPGFSVGANVSRIAGGGRFGFGVNADLSDEDGLKKIGVSSSGSDGNRVSWQGSITFPLLPKYGLPEFNFLLSIKFD